MLLLSLVAPRRHPAQPAVSREEVTPLEGVSTPSHRQKQGFLRERKKDTHDRLKVDRLGCNSPHLDEVERYFAPQRMQPRPRDFHVDLYFSARIGSSKNIAREKATPTLCTRLCMHVRTTAGSREARKGSRTAVCIEQKRSTIPSSLSGQASKQNTPKTPLSAQLEADKRSIRQAPRASKRARNSQVRLAPMG